MKHPYTLDHVDIGGKQIWIAESLALRGVEGRGDTRADAINALAANEEVRLQAGGDDHDTTTVPA